MAISTRRPCEITSRTEASSSAAPFDMTNCASTWNDSNNLRIAERQELARPPPATELTNTVTEDSSRMEEASGRSCMQLFLGYRCWNHVRWRSTDLNVCLHIRP